MKNEKWFAEEEMQMGSWVSNVNQVQMYNEYQVVGLVCL